MGIKIGIDEAGRGCLAGPVSAGAVSIPAKLDLIKLSIKEGLPELRDSKKMTPRARSEWYDFLRHSKDKGDIAFAHSFVSPKTVDRINISNAANKAAWNAFLKTIRMASEDKAVVSLDGSLYLKNRKSQMILEQYLFDMGMTIRISARTVIGGDRTIPEVMLGSVVAKVARDRLMERIAKKAPDYSFELHKGYGTRKHVEAIKKYGIIEGFHRKTFISGIFPG